MSLRTSPIIKMPDTSKVEDKATRDVFEQMLRFFFDNQKNIHDDLNDAATAMPLKATQAQAEAAADDAAYMTALQVKNEVQKAGAVAIPLDNIPSIPESKLTISDNTTGDATTSAHGFFPKLVNDATKFLNGLGNWVQITIDSILPSQTGNGGKFLYTDGSSASWQSVAGTYTADATAVIASAITERSTIAATYTKMKEITLDAGGSVSVSFDLKVSNSTAYGKIYKNGSAVGTERTNNTATYATFTETISGLAAGDKLQIYIKNVPGGGGDTAYTRNFIVRGTRCTINTD